MLDKEVTVRVRPLTAIVLLLASLWLAGCASDDERRDELIERRDALNVQLDDAAGTPAHSYDDPAMDRLYEAIDQTDRELRELERD